MEDTKNCINCGSLLSGTFCASCGQKTNVKRLSIKTFLEDYVSRLFGMDTNLFRTIKDLSLRPGTVGKTFIKGNRVTYIGPVGYFFLISTFLILTYQLLGIDIKDFINQSSSSIDDQLEMSQQDVKFEALITNLMANNLKIFGFLVIPFFAVWGKVFFKSSKYNFFEHSVNILYVQGHLAFLKIASLVIFKYSGLLISSYSQIIGFLFFVWSCVGFYNAAGVKNILKASLLYAVSTVSYIIVVVLITYALFVMPEYINNL